MDWPVVSRPGQPVGFDMRPSWMGSQHGRLPELSAAWPSRHHPLIRAPWALTLVRWPEARVKMKGTKGRLVLAAQAPESPTVH